METLSTKDLRKTGFRSQSILQPSRTQMPVYGHAERLFVARDAAAYDRARRGAILLGQTVIEIQLRVKSDAPAQVSADEPVIEPRGGRARNGQAVIQRITAVGSDGPETRELVVRASGESISGRSLEHARTFRQSAQVPEGNSAAAPLV